MKDWCIRCEVNSLGGGRVGNSWVVEDGMWVGSRCWEATQSAWYLLQSWCVLWSGS